MTDLGPQNCPYECGARYAAAVVESRAKHDCPECEREVRPCPTCEALTAVADLEAADGWHCSTCSAEIAPCSVCRALVSLGAVWDQNQCPACGTHRLDLGDAWRDRHPETEVCH